MGDLYWREHPDKWPHDVNGYAICPNCGAMVHARYTKVHAGACQRSEGDDWTPPPPGSKGDLRPVIHPDE